MGPSTPPKKIAPRSQGQSARARPGLADKARPKQPPGDAKQSEPDPAAEVENGRQEQGIDARQEKLGDGRADPE